jgi:hypothetical protein
MRGAVTAALSNEGNGGTRLLAHHAVLDLEPDGVPARDRLDEELGDDMARRLVAALSPRPSTARI